MGSVGWIERFGSDKKGVDQLGLRVAGEHAYSQLIDFTTTVAWRARYFSFLCWLLDRAFREAGGRHGDLEHDLDVRKWYRSLQRFDYTMALASRLADPKGERLAGRITIDRRIKQLRKHGGMSMSLSIEHLSNKKRSLSIYMGPMRNLGLVESAGEIDRPAQRGEELARAFDSCVKASGARHVFDFDEAEEADLARLGSSCGLTLLEAIPSPEASAERDALRELVLERNRFDGGRGSSAPRILSVGLILRIHELAGDQGLSLDDFRAAILLDGPWVDDERLELGLPTRYDTVRSRWRMYQAHAYATFALESLLGALLYWAHSWEGGAPYTALLERTVNSAWAGSEESRFGNDGAMREWWSKPLGEILDEISNQLPVLTASRCEPGLFTSIRGMAKHGWSETPLVWAHDSALMMLMTFTRIRLLLERDGSDAWIGSGQGRLPPDEIAEHVGRGVREGMQVKEYLLCCLHELVVRQHRRNALRKLRAVPRRDTSKLVFEGSRLVPLNTHSPGTSNPRYGNAVLFLRDLGYLDRTGRITPDGRDLLRWIARGGAT